MAAGVVDLYDFSDYLQNFLLCQFLVPLIYIIITTYFSFTVDHLFKIIHYISQDTLFYAKS